MSRALTRCPVCGREMARPGRYKLQLFREEGQRGCFYLEYDMSTYLCKRCGHAVKRLLEMLREEGKRNG